MNATLEHVQPTEVTEAFLTPFQEHADRGRNQTFAPQYRFIADSTTATVEGLVEWMDKEGYVFARKVTDNP